MPRFLCSCYGNMERFHGCEVEAKDRFGAHYQAHMQCPFRHLYIHIEELQEPSTVTLGEERKDA